MTDLSAFFQEVLPYYQTLSDTAEKCMAELEGDAYDKMEHYLDLRQYLLDMHIAPLMDQIETHKAKCLGTYDGPLVREEESLLGGLIRQILEKDRRCMEKVQAEREVLQSTLRELQNGFRTVQGYGRVSRTTLLVNEKV